MKRFFLLLLAAPVMLIACKKMGNVCQNQDPSIEAPAMSAFCVANGITATVDSVGNYYQIIDPGTGPGVVSKYDTIMISYEGKLLDGTTFDKGDSLVAYAGNVIAGVQYALVKIKEGGHIKIVMPSYLAYGCTGNSKIPPNKPLYFDLTLDKVRNYKQ